MFEQNIGRINKFFPILRNLTLSISSVFVHFSVPELSQPLEDIELSCTNAR